MDIPLPSSEEYQKVLEAANRMKLDVSNASIHQFVVVMNNSDVMGFVRTVNKGEIVELSTLGVVRKYRGTGMGAILVKNLQENNQELYLVTVIPALFEKYGFNKTNKVPQELQPKVNQCSLWHGFGEPVVMLWSK